MKLVIAEKNSAAQSLSRVIGATKRQNGYLEGKTYNADLLLSTEADGRPQFSMESPCSAHLTHPPAARRSCPS